MATFWHREITKFCTAEKRKELWSIKRGVQVTLLMATMWQNIQVPEISSGHWPSQRLCWWSCLGPTHPSPLEQYTCNLQQSPVVHVEQVSHDKRGFPLRILMLSTSTGVFSLPASVLKIYLVAELASFIWVKIFHISHGQGNKMLFCTAQCGTQC